MRPSPTRRNQGVGEAMKYNQLAAARRERRQTTARRVVDDRIQPRVDERHIAIEIEVPPIPVRAEHPFEQRAEGRMAADRLLQEGPAECVGHLAARQPAVIGRLAVSIGRPGVKGTRRRNLALGEAVVRRRTLA